jgi:bifunctional UDP-N-acetylglucosamine pyrophosphorylase/glucosamine-1-phosphate N-acetyltransferase
VNLSIVILAAGQGKRMKSDMPKVLQPIAGKPLLQHVVDTARRMQPLAIHVVYGHGADQVQQALAGQDLQWALQAQQKGTGHAVMQAMPAIPDNHTVLILYGDVPLNRLETLAGLVKLAGPKSMGLLTVMLDDATGYGRIVRDARGQIQKIAEQKDASKAQLKIREGNTGVMAVPAKLLRKWLGKLKNHNAQGEYYLTDIIAMAVQEKVKVTPVIAPTMAEVLGINDKLQLAEVEALHRQLRARELMLAGVTVIDPTRLDVRGEVSVGRDVVLDVNVILEGRVVLGDRVRVGANCVISNATIGADTVLQPNCVVDRAEVGPECQIGPFSRLRPDAKLHRDVHIGNFVEVKKSELGAGSKANHLSYIGDAVIGLGVNVGAGTITCNYDGANKWITTIEDGAFVGSGSMLVAPVTIGKGATIGAGSTISKNAPPGQLTLERARQATIEGWTRPQKKTTAKQTPEK